MGFTKKIYSKENIQKIAETGDIELFKQYFKADGHSFVDEYSNNVYLQLIEAYRIKDSKEKELAILNLLNFCNSIDEQDTSSEEKLNE